MVAIGLADSANPTTVAPALYLASADHARRQVAEFTLAVFAVYLVGGLAVALGPGQLLLALVPHPGRRLGYVLELVAGGVMLSASAFLWGYRDRLVRREPAAAIKIRGRSGAVLGATITAIELPTAFPYFAAIAAVVTSRLDIVGQIVLIVVFNLCFVLPLLAVLATLTFAGPDALRLLMAGRLWLESRWPKVLAILALLAGLFALLLGATGLGSLHHTDFGSFSRGVRHLLHT
jgi:cytochrome c biogenesis protein CcdA